MVSTEPMDTYQLTPIDSPPPKKQPGMTKRTVVTLWIILVVAFLIAGASFYFGFRHQQQTIQAAQPATPTSQDSTTPSDTPSDSGAPTPTDTDTPTPTEGPTSTPTPTHAPTSTPTPTPNPITITNVSASVSPSTGTTCPQTFQFTGSITITGSGVISYKWDRSDGTSSDSQLLTFTTSGQQSVKNISWDKPDPGASTASGQISSGSMKIHITSPVDTTSNDATFSVTCP